MSTTYNVSSGVTSTGLYLSDGDTMYVFYDGKADNTTLDTYGHLTVYNGGVADRTTHTGWESYFTVDQGGLASRTTLTVGYLDVYDGGVADDVDIISGVLYVTSGGTATGVKWTPCTGAYHVESGGTVTLAGSYSGVYYGSDFQLLSSAATMDGKKLTSGCTMCVMDGGTAKDTEASDYGTVYVYSGGVASNTTLLNYGHMGVSSGGSAHEVSVTAAGLYISFDGKADAVAVHGDGFLEISGGGVADGVTVSSAGSIFIGSGGVANNVTIEKGGSMDIGSGGVATGVVWTPCEGGLLIGNGGIVTFTSEYSGVYYGGGKSHELLSNAASMDGKSIASGYEMHVMNGGVANDAALSYMGRMDVYSGGVANSPVLNDYGYMYVHSGGVAKDAAVNSGYLRIYSGGVASKAVLDGNGHVEVLSGGTAKDTVVSGAGGYSSGILLVSSGGTAQGVSVKPYGSVEVESGGTATGIDWTPCVGRVAVYEGGSATFVSEYSGVYYGAEEQLLSSAGTMEGKELGYHYRMYVMNGGAANNATVNSDGSMYISSGGVANNTTVNSGGYIWIYSGGTASMGVVSSGGVVDVGSGGVARDMTICGRTGGWWNSGTIRVNSGGTAVDTTVSSGGQLTVYAGGVASNVTVKYNGSIYLNGKVTGRMNFEYGAVVSANEAYGSPVLDFDLTQTTAGADALVTTLSVINGTPKYTLTVAGTEADGTYKLAADAYGFDKTISVVDTSGTELGTLTVGGDSLTVGTKDYTLTLDDENDVLAVTVTKGPDLTGDLNTAFTLTDGMYAKKVNVNDGGELEVFGTARKTVINKNGMVYVSAGGLVEDVIVNEGGFLGNHYGVVRGATVSGGEMNVGGQAYDTVVEKDGTVRAYNVLSNTTINAGGCVFAMKGATYNTTVNKGGELVVHAEARDMTVNQGGRLAVSAGGRITGKMTFEEGAFVVVESGATVDFDLTQAAPGEEALLNDLSRITGTPSYRILITGDETEGTYNLAGGAAGFDKTITVYDITISSLSIPRPFVTVGGESVEIGGKKYTLALDDSLLTLTVGDATPPNGPAEPMNNTLLINKTTVNTDVTESYGTHLTAAGQEIRLDKIGTVDYGEKHYHNHVGKSAEESDTEYKLDYAKIVLEHGAKLSFHAEATAAATFTVYSLTEKKGKYTMKKLQTLKLKDKDNDSVFSADSKKPVELPAAGEYYVSMQFTDKKAEEAYYNVTLNDGARPKTQASVFYPLGNNSDDWGDKKTAGWGGAIDNRGTVTAATDLVTGEWVGFGDKTDYKKFTLDSAAELDFVFSASNGHSPVKFTIGKLKKTEKASGTTYSLVTIKSKTVAANKPSAELNALRLEAGEYYIKAESTNVKKDTGYDIQITRGDFYTDGDDGWNNVLLDGKKLNENAAYFYDNKLAGSGAIHFDKAGNDKYSDDYAEFTYNDKPYGGFVGFGDEIDFAKLTLMETSDVTFTLNATNSATLEIIKVTKNGEKYSKKSMQTIKYKQGSEDPATSKKAVTLEVKDGVSYYVSVKATNIKKTTVNPRTYYDVTYAVASEEESALSMPETAYVASALAMPDSLSLVQYDTDVLAGMSPDPASDKLFGESNTGLLASL